MTVLTGMIFSARSGGNLYDLANLLFEQVSAQWPDLTTELIEIAGHKVSPCNGCQYECLLGKAGENHCPIDDDVMGLWQKALHSEMVVYFLPNYGGMPPATWVAFQERYHGVFRHLTAGDRHPNGKIAALTLYEPLGSKTGDISQQVIIRHLANQDRRLISFEQIVPSNYGANSLRQRLIEHEGIRGRVASMSERIVQELRSGAAG